MALRAQRPPVPSERPTPLWLNGDHLVTVQTTPVALSDWALGFLFTEGIVASAAAIAELVVQVDPPLVEVRAEVAPTWDRELANRRYLTSGCGRGITFSSLQDVMALRPVRHRLQVDHAQLAVCQQAMQGQALLYRQSGGMHAAAIAHIGSGAMVTREDIGRHNAVDKALGAALLLGWDRQECVLVTSGRISYEMCAKLARSGLAVGASRTAATDQAVRLANHLGITLVGYLRPTGMRVYCDATGRIRMPAATTP